MPNLHNIFLDLHSKHLLFGLGVQVFSQASFGEGTGRIWLENVACTGNERALMNCSASYSGNNCSHDQDAGVRCPSGIHKCMCTILYHNNYYAHNV